MRIVAPFAPGGSADTLGRMVAERLSVRFRQNFVVDNRPGAGGTVGSELVAASAPDGYTLRFRHCLARHRAAMSVPSIR